MTGEIAHKGKMPLQPGERWPVERTNAWHNNFNRLQRCYERREDVIDAFFDLLKTYTDTATGTKADRSEWNKCLADLRPGDTLIIWKIDRLGRNLRDLIEIVTTLETRGVGVKSLLTNGIVDTTTAHGKLVFGIFALMAEYEAALIQERIQYYRDPCYGNPHRPALLVGQQPVLDLRLAALAVPGVPVGGQLAVTALHSRAGQVEQGRHGSPGRGDQALGRPRTTRDDVR